MFGIVRGILFLGCVHFRTRPDFVRDDLVLDEKELLQFPKFQIINSGHREFASPIYLGRGVARDLYLWALVVVALDAEEEDGVAVKRVDRIGWSGTRYVTRPIIPNFPPFKLEILVPPWQWLKPL